MRAVTVLQSCFVVLCYKCAHYQNFGINYFSLAMF